MVFILFISIISIIFFLNIRQLQKSSYQVILDNISASTCEVLDSINKSLAESETSVQILSSFIPATNLSEDSSVWFFFYKDLQNTIGLLESKDYQEANLHYFTYNYVQDYFLKSNTHSINIYEEKLLGEWLKDGADVKNNIWQDIVLMDTDYLIYTMKKGDFYLGVFVPVPALLDKFARSSTEKTEIALVLRDNENLITETNSLVAKELYSEILSYSNQLTPVEKKSEGQIHTVEKYTIQSYPSKYGFSIITVTSQSDFDKNLIRNNGLLILFISAIMIFSFYFLTLKKCIKPLVFLQYAFSRVSAGDLSFRMRENVFTNEYNEVSKSFNMMVREIKDLRMNYYEEKLLQQQAENRYLRAISYPHFLLNNLNLINNFAYENNEQGIHDIVLNLSKYLRYFITADFAAHKLRNDVESAKSYLNLNSLAYPGRLTYNFEVNESLLDICFPPLIISTIVENCIKHGLVPGEKLDIGIILNRKISEDRDYLIFKCINSGPAFPQEIIDSINSKEISNNSSTHIGLTSIKNTLYSQYNDQVVFTINNTDNGVIATIELEMQALEKNL